MSAYAKNAPQQPVPFICIEKLKGAHSTSYRALIKMREPRRRKGSKTVRIYVGTLSSRTAAEQACKHFIATGEKPAPAPRGPKGCRTVSDVRRGTYNPAPRRAASPERLEMIRRIAARFA